MPSTFSSVPCLWLRIYLLVLSFFALPCQGAPLTGPDEYACNVCRESPEGERVLINPSKSFTQSSGRKTTCGELQEWVQDVQPSGGSPGEAELCGLTQYLAWFYLCDCEGPAIPSPIDNVKVNSVFFVPCKYLEKFIYYNTSLYLLKANTRCSFSIYHDLFLYLRILIHRVIFVEHQV
jgi:hypothetical protein